MKRDTEVSIEIFLKHLARFRAEMEAEQINLDIKFERLSAELQPCATTFREFHDAAVECRKIGGRLSRMVSEILLGTLPSPTTEG